MKLQLLQWVAAILFFRYAEHIVIACSPKGAAKRRKPPIEKSSE